MSGRLQMLKKVLVRVALLSVVALSGSCGAPGAPAPTQAATQPQADLFNHGAYG